MPIVDDDHDVLVKSSVSESQNENSTAMSQHLTKKASVSGSRWPRSLNSPFRLLLLTIPSLPSATAWISSDSLHSPGHQHSRVTLASTSSQFLDQVWETIDNVLGQSKTDHPHNNNNDTAASDTSASSLFRQTPPTILDLPTHQRESVGVSWRLFQRLSALRRNDDCPACWLQRVHCICDQTPPLEHALLPPGLQRVFLILHHKEVGLLVDTAKLLLSSMPHHARLVVAGIDEQYQASLGELQEAIQQSKRPCLVLFPTDDARTFPEIMNESINKNNSNSNSNNQSRSFTMDEYDLIVLDGTWQQARRMHQRYIPLEADGGPPRVCLSDQALERLGGVESDVDPSSIDKVNDPAATEVDRLGRQLRRHPIPWKEVSTLEATRLLFQDILVAAHGSEETKEQTTGVAATNKAQEDVPSSRSRKATLVATIDSSSIPRHEDGATCYDLLQRYQVISDAAARRQLGPPRQKGQPVSKD